MLITYATDAIKFANSLSKFAGYESCYTISDNEISWDKGISCLGFRLPTEAVCNKSNQVGSVPTCPTKGFIGARTDRPRAESSFGFQAEPNVVWGSKHEVVSSFEFQGKPKRSFEFRNFRKPPKPKVEVMRELKTRTRS